MLWLFTFWGSGVGLEPGQLGAAFYIVTVLVPLLLITHVLVLRLLLLSDAWSPDRKDHPPALT